MYFGQAIKRMVSDTVAIKTPNMLGYIKRDSNGPDASPVRIQFVNRSGSTTMSFYLTSSLDYSTAGTEGTFSGEMFEMMMSNDWIVGTLSEFETARSGSDRAY